MQAEDLGSRGGALQLFLCLASRNYMNDSLRTDVFVRFQPESIACACIYLAARTLEVSVLLLWRDSSLIFFFASLQ